MRRSAISFESKKLALEGILAIPDQFLGPHPGMLLCHPHPMLSGNMDHPVLTAISNAADTLGIATMRFNFRGVGGSDGAFNNGKGEQDDTKSALNVLRRWPGIDSKRLLVVGYSFGASVVLNNFKQYRTAKAFVLISPPMASLDRSHIKKDKRPKLFITGRNDQIASSLDLQRIIDEVRPPAKFAEIANADHSLRDHESEVASHVAEFAAEVLQK